VLSRAEAHNVRETTVVTVTRYNYYSKIRYNFCTYKVGIENIESSNALE
jgi:hypothetical protein